MPRFCSCSPLMCGAAVSSPADSIARSRAMSRRLSSSRKPRRNGKRSRPRSIRIITRSRSCCISSRACRRRMCRSRLQSIGAADFGRRRGEQRRARLSICREGEEESGAADVPIRDGSAAHSAERSRAIPPGGKTEMMPAWFQRMNPRERDPLAHRRRHGFPPAELFHLELAARDVEPDARRSGGAAIDSARSRRSSCRSATCGNSAMNG